MLKKVFLFLLIVPLVYSCLNSNAEEVKATVDGNIEAGEKPEGAIPSFKMFDQQGNTVNLADLKGKKVFVNIWASWCPPCRAEMPSIEKLYSKVDKAKTAFVLLSLDEAPDNGIRFAQKTKLSAPVYFPGENLPALFNVQSIPTTFIFDEKGKMTHRINGGENYDTEAYIKLFSK
ncbi:TlpA family protein disulfide reductase [Terrimonas pollutisoli]|uniref:TlpA family protein disulfide reductase n=1 Tax=Terrimonas pollutisoli TaxID=3034147 RepID=UPI0023EC8080|nr:TlpA disulfide reductase family protein [Terrimonas sp. H1YJ31]